MTRALLRPVAIALGLCTGCVLVSEAEKEEWLRAHRRGGDTGLDSSSPEEEIFCESPSVPMTYIPRGSFDMGSPPGEVAHEDEELLHEVTLGRDFAIATSEITKGQYAEATGSKSFSGCGEDCPVGDLTWHQAAEFTNLMSDCESRPRCYVCEGSDASLECVPVDDFQDCEGYRLPTEAEWEYAARAGSSGSYQNGADIDDAYADTCDEHLELSDGSELDDLGWFFGNSGDEPHPVGEREPNDWGLLDVHGNIEEWTNDWYDPEAYSHHDEVDPFGPLSGETKVVRGGSYRSCGSTLRLAKRSPAYPSRPDAFMGLRILRIIP